MARQLNAAAARQRRPLDDVHARAVMALHVAVAGREILRPPRVEIPGHGQRLQKYLRHHDRAAEVQDKAAVIEVRQGAGEALEVAVTRRAEDGTVGRRLLVNDGGARVYARRACPAPCFACTPLASAAFISLPVCSAMPNVTSRQVLARAQVF